MKIVESELEFVHEDGLSVIKRMGYDTALLVVVPQDLIKKEYAKERGDS